MCRSGRAALGPFSFAGKKDSQEPFLGTYDEFLSTVGWQEEVEEKEEKKARPEKPVKKSNKGEIEKCESKIGALEASVAKNNEKLALIAHTGKGDEIKKLLAEIDGEQNEIDALYERLEQLYKSS